MDPLVAFLVAALTGMGGFSAWLLKQFIAHLEKDIEYSRRTASRGVETAEKAATEAERLGR